jgi:hypothetical protein
MENRGGDRFYDDNQWIGISFMDVYNRTGKSQFLQTAKSIYQFILCGYDTLAVVAFAGK